MVSGPLLASHNNHYAIPKSVLTLSLIVQPCKDVIIRDFVGKGVISTKLSFVREVIGGAYILKWKGNIIRDV